MTTSNPELCWLPCLRELRIKLLEAIGESSNDDDGIETSPIIRSSMNYALKNIGDPKLDVAHMARAAGFSESLVKEHFRAIVGIQPWACVIALRVQDAKRLLCDRSKSLEEIAKRVGMNAHNFSDWFKRNAGMTPMQYRKSQIGSSELDKPQSRKK